MNNENLRLRGTIIGQPLLSAELDADHTVNLEEHVRRGPGESKWLRVLTDREIRVLRLRLAGATLAAVGRSFGVTRERCRQLEAKALRKIGRVVSLPATAHSAAAPCEHECPHCGARYYFS